MWLIDFWLIVMLIGIPSLVIMLIVKLAVSSARDVSRQPPPAHPVWRNPALPPCGRCGAPYAAHRNGGCPPDVILLPRLPDLHL